MNIGHYIKSALRWTTRKGGSSANPIISCEGGVQEDEALHFTQQSSCATSSSPPTTSSSEESVHHIPPGQWPKEGPKPSKVAVLLFYLSVVFTIIGILIVIRSAFYVEEHDKPKILGMGLCMVTVGIALIIITNVINNHERERIMHYLERKVEELRYKENFRYERNRFNSELLKEHS